MLISQNVSMELLNLQKKFDQKKDYKGLLSGIPIAVKDFFLYKKY
ncbi:MAG: hypothetical protein Ct9H300mP5_5640 [Candidatus Pelagibacterales bacterium]|nr:MAG: hypothetical protein Ct9H300mP5_5640 [Pelagibacterales bacterium]